MISAVFQDFKLFSIRINQNIMAEELGNSGKVKEVLRDVGMLSRVEKMEAGAESHLYQDFDSNGIEISGGEAQKIAIAKAIYKDAPLFIMDEPTAALDPIAESEIYADFNSLLKHKTVVYISHRLSSCIFCDRILVFLNGKLVESGNHKQLLKNHGKYEELWEAQARHYK